MRLHTREINKEIRELDLEKRQLEMAEKKLIAEIKVVAKNSWQIMI